MDFNTTIAPLLRTALQFAAGLAVAKGIGDDQLWVAISGAIVSAAGAWYTWKYVKSNAIK